MADSQNRFEIDANQSNMVEQYNLANRYLQGNGITKDVNKAVEWYKKAAETGYIFAQYKLAECYLKGEVVEKDETKAYEWWKKAALHGHADSQYELANCYLNGVGVEKDVLQAYIWYQRASELGHAAARGKAIAISYSGTLDIFKERKGSNTYLPSNKTEIIPSSGRNKTIIILLLFFIFLGYLFFWREA